MWRANKHGLRVVFKIFKMKNNIVQPSRNAGRLNIMMKLVNRRKNIQKESKFCPKCNSNQQQLIKYFDFSKPAVFKCRVCKFEWEFDDSLLTD